MHEAIWDHEAELFLYRPKSHCVTPSPSHKRKGITFFLYLPASKGAIGEEAQPVNEILKRGCDGFLQKPFTLGELSKAIQEVVGKKKK